MSEVRFAMPIVVFEFPYYLIVVDVQQQYVVAVIESLSYRYDGSVTFSLLCCPVNISLFVLVEIDHTTASVEEILVGVLGMKEDVPDTEYVVVH